MELFKFDHQFDPLQMLVPMDEQVYDLWNSKKEPKYMASQRIVGWLEDNNIKHQFFTLPCFTIDRSGGLEIARAIVTAIEFTNTDDLMLFKLTF